MSVEEVRRKVRILPGMLSYEGDEIKIKKSGEEQKIGIYLDNKKLIESQKKRKEVRKKEDKDREIDENQPII